MQKFFRKLSIRSFCISALAGALFSTSANAATENKNQVIVHDPVIAKDGDYFYLFSTAKNISQFRSKNLVHWEALGTVFNEAPAMASKVAPGFTGDLWAPDIRFHNGTYYLYYSASAFGKNTSGIGVITNKTLDPQSPDYRWYDRGIVVQSHPGRDDWNAIDSAIAEDEKGNGWMVIGSFWSGLKLFKLNEDWTAPAEPQEWFTIAARPRVKGTDQIGAVEGGFIFKHSGYYYLFASWDLCCKGKDSTYNMRVGRAQNIRGPYLDKDGVSMADGGGSLVLAGTPDWPGVGHNSAYRFNNRDYLVFHAYDAADDFKPKLKVTEMQWDQEGWPVVDAKLLDKYESRLLKK